MVSQICTISTKIQVRPRSRRHRARRGAVALEFAIISIPFFMWLLFIFELSYDFFTQEALDSALNTAVRQIQTGNAASLTQPATSTLTAAQYFIQQDLCPATKGLLECGNIWLRVSAITTPDYSPPTTTGAVPMNGGSLDLSQYTNLAGANSGAGTTAYCVAQSSQAVLVSAVYIGPSFLGGLLPGILSASFGGNTVHPTVSTAGFVTEPYTPPNTPAGASGPLCG